MEDKNIYLCNDINYTKLNPYSLTSLVINNIQYPSVMLYIYSELLCFTKEKSKIFNSANKSLSPKELNKKFNILFEQCNNKLLRDALTLAYKMKISQENDCKKDLLTFNKNAINNSNLNPALKEIIIEIILNIKNEVENNIYLQNIDDNEINNNNKIFEIYKVYYALSNLLDDGYDIKEFIEKNQEQIKKMTFESDNENLSPLFFKKKKLFQQYYNNINPELMTDIVNRYRILPDNFKYIKDELLKLARKYSSYEWVQHHIYSCLARSQEFSAFEIREIGDDLDTISSWFGKKTIYMLLLKNCKNEQMKESILHKVKKENDFALKREVLSFSKLWSEKGINLKDLLIALGIER